MPESRHKYLYERLGDHDFQLLVNALLAAHFQDYVPLPLRQSDGGRDGLLPSPPSGTSPASTLVYQAKWSAEGMHKDPVAWLDAVVTREADNLRRLAREGARRYVLVTNVPSTAIPKRGTYDRLDAKLRQHAENFGFEQMSCLWRESLDGMLDSTPNEIKWQYADMLAGWDLVRYIVAEEAVGRRDRGLRALVRKVAAAQWDEDERVKFSQVDIDREKVADLFIDVTADIIHYADRRSGNGVLPEPVGGAAAYLLTAASGCVLVRGAPGQGKSTLSQFVSQVHRSAFVPSRQRPAGLPSVELPLFPLRLDLSDYARWLSGADVWDYEFETARKSVKRTASQSTIECFLAELMTHASGGIAVTAEHVQDMFDRVPSIVVLDGLDEVGRPRTRKKVVDAIDRFCARARAGSIPPRVVVTTRPSSNVLPEPSSETFDVIVLNPLDRAQRDAYLRKWCTVRGITGVEGKALRKSFKAKSKEPYIGELAGNPMQLTILLDLLHKHGEATPTQRTELYDSYVDLLLAREANKHPESVRKHQQELREIVPFLGWYLQAHSEESSVNARMSVDDLKAAIRHFQRAYGKVETIVDALFEATSDRLWALTSKNEGTFEFEVLSLREYFAARFLYKNAGEDSKGFDRNTVFRELLRRPYWLNTARFYGGNAESGEVFILAEGIRDEVGGHDRAPSSVVAAWTLLTDGVFARRPRLAREVLGSLCADHNVEVLLDALERREIIALPELPQLQDTDGADPTWARLTTAIAANPADSDNPRRVRVLRTLLNQRPEFATWWADRMRDAAQQPTAARAGADAWLKMAARCEGAAGATLDLDYLDLTQPLVAQRVLDTGLLPSSGSRFEADLIRAVLDGLCPEVTSTRSLPAQIAVAFSTEAFLTDSTAGFSTDNAYADRRRREAILRLRKADSPFADIAALRRFKAGEKDSTFPWSNTASALFDQVGRCWLASLIAVIGAASPHKLAYTRRETTTPFGPDAHPTTLLAQSHANRANAYWWRDQLDRIDTTRTGAKPSADEDLFHAEWALALWCVATESVLSSLFTQWQSVFTGLSALRRYVVADAASRMGAYGWLKPLASVERPSNKIVARLLDMREPQHRAPLARNTPVHRPAVQSPPLLDIARNGRWFTVDNIGSYR